MALTKLSCVTLLFALSWFSGFAQRGTDEEALASFSAFKDDGKVFIDWTIKAGFSCTDVRVEQSVNGIDFSPVYIYPGICGEIEKEETYAFVHNEPKTGTVNYYRLNLDFYGMSDTKSVFVVNYVGKGITIFPMPANSSTVIYFQNPFQRPSDLIITDASGRTVYSRQNITGTEIQLSEARLTAGTYFYILSNNDNTFRGKIVHR